MAKAKPASPCTGWVNRADAGDIVAQQAVAIGADDAALTRCIVSCALPPLSC
ncbi:hypothetical protein RKK42_28180 [Klebsiella pneumoniae]|nr:hypothetical protein [Klebsiella pneumoniae]